MIVQKLQVHLERTKENGKLSQIQIALKSNLKNQDNQTRQMLKYWHSSRERKRNTRLA
jgi:hypothetical protein